jgi:hypothetical protein
MIDNLDFEPLTTRCLFVGNIPFSTQWQEIKVIIYITFVKEN